MTDSEQIDAFQAELRALLDRFAEEFDLTYAAVIGTMQIEILRLAQMQIEDEDEDDE